MFTKRYRIPLHDLEQRAIIDAACRMIQRKQRERQRTQQKRDRLSVQRADRIRCPAAELQHSAKRNVAERNNRLRRYRRQLVRQQRQRGRNFPRPAFCSARCVRSGTTGRYFTTFVV